jgi:hypothetical protein
LSPFQSSRFTGCSRSAGVSPSSASIVLND